MKVNEFNEALRGLAIGGNFGLSDKYKSTDNAKEILKEMIRQLYLQTKIPIEKLIEDIVSESKIEYELEISSLKSVLKENDTIIKEQDKIIDSLKADLEKNKSELEKAATCTTVKPTLGYRNSFSVEIYEEMDNMIRAGYSNKAISDKLGMHRNTVSARRSKIK